MRNHALLPLLLASTLAAGCRDRVIAVPASTSDLARAAQLGQPGQMSVTGTATLDVSPDCADLTLTLSADAARPGIATSSVEAKERALVGALHHLGLADGDLKLSYVTLDPIYEPTPNGWAQLKVHTYRAQITVTATTRDFAKVGAIMEAGATAGATSMSSQFRRSDLAALKKQVRAMALAAVKDKAKQTADALDIKLGRIVSVAEAPAGTMWNAAYFPQVANAEMSRDTAVALGGTLQPLTLTITVGYELARET